MNRHPRRVLEWGFGLGLLLSIVLTLGLARRQAVAAQVRADTIRLHILANSDTIQDQMLKLSVRDAILEDLPDAVKQAQTPEQALTALRNALPLLQYTANQTLLAAHSGQTATVRLEDFAFAARDYGSFVLPEGTYTALRVELGAAQGHNWFCVLYPALCVSGATVGYPTAEENALVFGRYEVRLALLDAWRMR